jgi:hypothetical protein
MFLQSFHDLDYLCGIPTGDFDILFCARFRTTVDRNAGLRFHRIKDFWIAFDEQRQA